MYGYTQDREAVRKRVSRYLLSLVTPDIEADVEEESPATVIPNKPIGVFSDTHIPFNHPNYLRFILDTFAKYDVGMVICLGDLVDNHAISRHQTETRAKSPYDELDMSIAEVKKFTAALPNAVVCLGNHDLIATRQAATLGIGERFLKTFHEIYEVPDTWILKEELLLDGVLYKHGINCGGKDGAYNAALKERTSVVIGHSHAYAGCKYAANKRDIVFGMNVGCGIDVDAYAFEYGKHASDRPILGCGIVYSADRAEFIPMSAEYFRSYRRAV